MGEKRGSDVLSSNDEHYTKRSRNAQAWPETSNGGCPSRMGSSSVRASSSAGESRVDPTYGQRGAFPGLDDGSDYSGDDALGQEALAYLRSVRYDFYHDRL